MVKYETLQSTDATSVYFDDNERKGVAGQPSFGVVDLFVLFLIYVAWIITLPFTICFSLKMIPQFQRIIVYRLGRILPLKGPGLVIVIPFIDRIKRIDMRMRAFKVPPQEIMTIDNGVVKVGADVQYRYINPILTQTIQDLDHSLRVTGQSSLTSLLSSEELSFVKHEKHLLQQRLQSHMNKAVSAWGIEIARFEIEQSVVIKERGGTTPPSQDDGKHDGAAMIMNLLKNVTSPDNNILPGMFMPNMPGLSQSSSAISQSHQTPQNDKALLTPRELFCIAKGIVNESVCKEVDAVFQFCISTVDGNVTNWTVDAKNFPGFVMEGESNSLPDVIFTLSEQTFQQIF